MSVKKYIKDQKLRDLSVADLGNRVRELRAEEYQLRFDRVTGKLENVSRIVANRRRLAAVLTIQREKELAAKGGK
jgi:large subunit ribosomal protein L29